MKLNKKTNKIGFGEKFSYGCINLGNIPIMTLINGYLLIFYTNICGMDPKACATLFLIARILDGLNDPLVGFCIDRLPNTRLGHFRMPLIVGTILCGLNFLLLWFGPMMAPSGKLVIAYVSYILIGVLFPVMDISLNSLLPVMTEDMNYRNTSIVGLAAALGMGVSQASASLSAFPAWVTTIFGKSPVVIATLVAIILNVTLPRDKKAN